MPTLHYTSLKDLQRVLSESQLTRVLPGDYGETPLSYDNLPSDAFADPAWSQAAFALLTAEGEVNSYLGTLFDTPLLIEGTDAEGNPAQVAPEPVPILTLTIAKYRLYQGRTVPEDVEKQYDEAVAYLRRVQRGDISLPGAEEKEQSRIRFGKNTSGQFGPDHFPL